MAAILLFDGVCNSCNWIVDLLLRADRKGRLRFGSLQSDAGRRLLAQHGLPPGQLDTLVLIEEGRVLTRSTAAFRVLRLVGWPWSLLAAARILPRPFTDRLYDLFARSRYRLFGKRDSCRLLRPEEKARFLPES